MKRLLLAFVLAALTAGYAEETKKRDALDIRPEAAVNAAKTGVEWENTPENEAALKAATAERALADIVRDEASAKKRLAQIKGAYRTDALVARQVAAVTQWVMANDDVAWYDFWSDTPHADGRKVWVEALVATAETAKDAYIQEFMLDQLRWCGYDCPCLIARIRALATKSGDKAVIDLADMVIRELEGKAIGL